MSQLELVNVVATGDIHHELDLSALSEDLDAMFVDYSPKKFVGAKIRYSSDSPTVLLFDSGKFTITGAENKSEIRLTTQRIKNSLYELDILDENDSLESEIVNLVYSGEFELNISLDLLMTVLGYENSEYEPEISPFLIYRPENIDCVITVSGSGKIVVTGVRREKIAKLGLNTLEKEIEKFG